MVIKTRVRKDIKVLELAGRFDASTVDPVRDWIEDATREPPAYVVVNMEKVDFVDSTGLSALVQGLKRAREYGGNLHICGLQQPVRIIFELTRLDQYFQIFMVEEDAVAAILQQSP